MGERKPATFAVRGMPVARCLDGGGLDPVLSPRPHLHPVRPVAGTVLTDALPAARGLRALLADTVRHDDVVQTRRKIAGNP